MKLGYTIIYVPSVAAALKFFIQAFEMKQKFLHESGDYGAMNFSKGYVAASESAKPLGVEIALVTSDVQKAHASAVAHGATELVPPQDKPWGQTVSYVRTPDGMLVELCTPVHG
jgi:lactoylglutathione lyase